MKRLFRHFLAGVAIAVGLFAGGTAITGLRAASVPLFTGPSGINPVNNPADLADINSAINTINAYLAPGGVGLMPGYVALSGTAGSSGVIQILSAGDWTATTSSCTGGTGGDPTNTTQCLILYDQTGTKHYIPAY